MREEATETEPLTSPHARPVPGFFTLTRLLMAVPLTDRFICHLVMVTCWDGFTAHVPLTLGCLKSGCRIHPSDGVEAYQQQA